MSKIEEFNHRLNQSLRTTENRDSSFRDQVDLILRSLLRSMKTKENVCIIGAGKCQDFSLPIFIEEFRRIVLTDVDIETVKNAVGNRHRLELKQVEYTGFEEFGFFNDFKERIVNSRDYKKIDQIIAHKLEDIKHYQFLEEEFGSMDLVYVSPIYTQLVYQQVLRECSLLRENGFPEHFIKYIESLMLDEMMGVIERFNRNIMNLLKDEGRLVVLSDIFELEPGSDFHLRVTNAIRNKDVIEEIHKGYLQKYGFGLGDYGLYNLDENMFELKSRWMLWTLTDKKSYAVKLKIYKKFSIEGGTL